MKTRLTWILSILAMLSLLLVSCAGSVPPAPAAQSQQQESEAEAVKEEPVEQEAEVAAEGIVTLEVWIGQSEYATCIQETVIEGFNAQSDNIVVESVAMEDVWGTARPAIAGGEGPDIVTTPGPSFVFELVQAGQLLSLEEAKNLYGWENTFAEFALNLGKVDGELYSLPDEMETLIVYYNKTLFEEKGWEIPNNIDELHALAAQIAEEDIIPFSHANAEWRPANEWHVGEYLNHVAGPDKVYQALTGQIEWTDPDFVLAIDMLNEAQQNGWYMGGLEFYYTTTFDDLHTALGTGEAAMNIEGTWAADGINSTWFSEETGGNEWDWFPVPSKSGDAIYDVGMGNTSSINANTEHPLEASEYLNYVFSPEIQAAAFVNCGKAPAPVVIPEGTITGIDSRIANIFEQMSASVASGDYGYTTWTFWPPKSDVYIYEEIEKVWAGDMTSEEYLAGLNELFREEFEAGEIPPIPDR
jgi:raffinose/stachyose/melibiose transport system substrate-binding protein